MQVHKNQLIYSAMEYCRPLYRYNNLPYHNFNHIYYMLNLLDSELSCGTFGCITNEDKTALELAIVFHDVVYNPKQKDSINVESSIAVFKLWANHPNNVVAIPYIEQVASLIELTNTHSRHEACNLGNILLDLDLAILGAEHDVYCKYVNNIRDEYNHVSEQDFNVARAKILNKFLLLAKNNELFKYMKNLNKSAYRNLKFETYAN